MQVTPKHSKLQLWERFLTAILLAASVEEHRGYNPLPQGKACIHTVGAVFNRDRTRSSGGETLRLQIAPTDHQYIETSHPDYQGFFEFPDPSHDGRMVGM